MLRRLAAFVAAVLVCGSVIAGPAYAAPLVVSDLSGGTTANDLANTLAGTGVTIDGSSVAYTGHSSAAGLFGGGTGIIGFEDGVVLSSGRAADIVGTNDAPNTSVPLGTPGDADLSALAGQPTFNASVLEFEFEVGPDADRVFFNYVFGSEEYNEYVGSRFNDVFAFFVNGQNCALVGDPALPVSVNTINNGKPEGVQPDNPDPFAPVNPALYVNNDPFHPDSTSSTVPAADLLETEMDGLTVVLTCEAVANPGTNSMRLAIADSSDEFYDAWVLIEQGSLTTVPQDVPPEASCTETTNPHGLNVPRAGQKSPGQNEDGYYVLNASDDVDPNPQIFVVDTGSGTEFGPFADGTKIKYTQANGAPPSQKKQGSANGAADGVDWHITGNGDAEVYAVDAAGNVSERVSCKVPAPPK